MMLLIGELPGEKQHHAKVFGRQIACLFVMKPSHRSLGQCLDRIRLTAQKDVFRPQIPTDRNSTMIWRLPSSIVRARASQPCSMT
jgi:hypothetical protein